MQYSNVSDSIKRLVWYKLIYLSAKTVLDSLFDVFHFFFFRIIKTEKRKSPHCTRHKQQNINNLIRKRKTSIIHWIAIWILFYYLKLSESEWNWIEVKWWKRNQVHKRWCVQCSNGYISVYIADGYYVALWQVAGLSFYSRLFSIYKYTIYRLQTQLIVL